MIAFDIYIYIFSMTRPQVPGRSVTPSRGYLRAPVVAGHETSSHEMCGKELGKAQKSMIFARFRSIFRHFEPFLEVLRGLKERAQVRY